MSTEIQSDSEFQRDLMAAFCIALIVHDGGRAMSMFTDPAFDDLSPEQTVNVVNNAVYFAAHPEVDASAMHVMFKNALTEQGFTYSPDQNDTTKQTPLLGAWEDLPAGYRGYFCLTQGLINALREPPLPIQPSCGEDIDEQIVAAVAHEVNRAYCRTTGDESQPTWADAPDWQRGSAVNGVRFHRANPQAGDSASHDNWMAEKLAAGWTHGPVKDADLKIHPCILPFEELPFEQQLKDRLFRAVVHALSAA